MDTMMTRRTVLALAGASALARQGTPAQATTPEDEPIWDCEIEAGWVYGDGTVFVSALRRGSIVAGDPEEVGWGSWYLSWPKQELLAHLGPRGLCEHLLDTDWLDEGCIGTVTLHGALAQEMTL